MPKSLRSISALGAVFFAGIGLAACGGGLPSDSVAQVQKSPITKEAFNHWMKVAAFSAGASTTTSTTSKPAVPVPPKYTACIAHLKATASKSQAAPTAAVLKSECAQQYTSYKKEVMLFLIGDAEWIIQEAKELGVHVTDKEVEKQLSTLKKQEFPKEESFNKFLSSTGYTVSDLLLKVKIDLLSSKIEQKVEKKATKGINEAKVASYYNLHKSTYGKPESKDLLVVLTKTEAQAKTAKQEIESGKSFSSVAKASSIEPTSKANGGKLTGVSRGQEEKALETAVFSAKENVLSGPIKTPFGYYVFEVTKTVKANQEPLSKVKSEIKQQLTATQEQSAMSAFLKKFQKKWKNRTECRAGFVVEDCKSYKKPKTTTTPAPATPAPATTTPATTTPATTTPATTTTSK